MRIYKISSAQKLENFGIKDPFLRFFVLSYSDNIDWNKIDRKDYRQAEKDLNEQIEDMYKELIKLADPDNPHNNYLKEYTGNIRLELINAGPALIHAQGRHIDELKRCKRVLKSQGDMAAKKLRVEQINKLKKESFDKWDAIIKSRYESNPAMAYMLMSFVLNSSPADSRTMPVRLNDKALSKFEKEMENWENNVYTKLKK